MKVRGQSSNEAPVAPKQGSHALNPIVHLGEAVFGNPGEPTESSIPSKKSEVSMELVEV